MTFFFSGSLSTAPPKNGDSGPEDSTGGSLVVLTDNKLLSLNGNTVEYEKELKRGYSEISWDGNNFYLATMQKGYYQEEGERVENELLVLDRNFMEVGSHHICCDPVYDFAAENGILYFLTGTKLKLLDLSQEDPSFQKTNRTVSFEKHVHDIIVKEDRAYLLDNMFPPLYIHLVDLPSLEVHTRELPAVNAHLAAQDVSQDKWYVLQSTSVMNGYFEDLVVFGSKSGQLAQDPESYKLVSVPRDSNQDADLEDFFQISSVLVDGQLAYGLGHDFSLPGDRELKLGIYSLEGDGTRLALIGLNDTSSVENSHIATNIVLLDSKVYVGGNNGVYVIDISDLGNPFASEIIETESPVRYIALV